MSSTAAIHAKAIELGKLAVRMTSVSGSGHPTSALSLAHLVTALMYRQMRYDPANPWDPAADRLVLSEGHAVPIVYAAYADLGGAVGQREGGSGKGVPLTIAELDQLRARDSVLDGHPNPAEGFPFFDAATGSLGMGLSAAAGLALAARRDGTARRVYCIVGDGESREGQIWEALDFIVDHQLTRVCVIFNCNAQGQAGYVSKQQSHETLSAKLTAFGYETVTIDGHDPGAILTAFAQFDKATRPFAIVARTVKGWGVETFLNGNWHGKPMPEKDLKDKCDGALDATRAKLGVKAEDAAQLGRPAAAARAKEPVRVESRTVAWPRFAEAMASAGLGGAVEKNALATRRAYGAALKVAGDLIPQVAVLDADVSNSTFSEIFAKAHPDRFFECKIAEQNMVSAAVGLAAAGHIPFANSFAKFLSRAYDQIELAAITRANIKLAGSHAGISLAADGPSQMAVVDVAFFRSLSTVRGDDRTSPVCRVFNPSDAVSAYHLTRLMCELRGMCYMRTYRPDVPLLYAADATFEAGGFGVFEPGGEIALVSAGYMTHVAKTAAGLLARQGVRATIIDLYTLPVAAEKLADTLRRTGGRALAVEDNYGGGIGSTVAEIAAADGGIRAGSAICQRIPKSTRTPEEILEYCGVGAAQLADRAMALLRQP
ncbi:MAG: transketolase [Phycisphaerales bacterium]|nr:transketolase [Phycisphaerales bacterium]